MIGWLLLAMVLYVALLGLKAAFAWLYATRCDPPKSDELASRELTIAQPILSGDPLLESRLEENLLALKDQHFLWFIDEDDSEARRIGEALRSKHPTTRIDIEICPPCPEATNPKLWKLQRSDGKVETPFFCVLDDDTTLPAKTAAALVFAAQNTAVATGLPCYLHSGDWPSILLAQFVNNNSAFTYLATSFLMNPFTLSGMGYVMKTEQLAKLEYFKPILHELTDDLALATLILRLGGDIHQSPYPLRVQTSVRDGAHYMQLMHRWYVFTLLLLKRQRLGIQGVIFVLHGLPPMLIVAILAMHVTLPWQLAGLAMSLLSVRWLTLSWVQNRYFGEDMTYPGASLISELMQPVHLIHALLVRTIRWRKRVYVVRDSNDFREA